jgi:hypothetical protein
MALERVPADIRAQGGVARMSDPKLIKEIMDAVTIPVMAKARIGHFVECQVWFFAGQKIPLLAIVTLIWHLLTLIAFFFFLFFPRGIDLAGARS